MRGISEREQAALAAVAKANQEEENRAFWWGLIPRQDKVRALLVANIDKRRTGDPLESFTIAERQAIAFALTSHIAKMELVIMTMGIGAANLAKKSTVH